jgi:hypothetical protein
LVDRLGRSLQDLVAFLSEIHAKGVATPVPHQKSFGDELEKQGFERGRVTGGTRGYRGIGLRYDPAKAGISHD